MNIATKHKLIDLKSCSRCSNIKITGLPEKMEKGNPTQFVAELLQQILKSNKFTSGLKVDWAHRIRPQPTTARPHTMIAKIHHFPEKEKNPGACPSTGSLIFQLGRINVYPNFLPEILEQCCAFDGAKKKLAGIKHGLLFPAQLIFTQGTEQKIFEEPVDAKAFIDRFTYTTIP